jgi:membrane protein YqaA with SNARE-associated domain
MRSADQIAEFVGRALEAGRSRAEITAALDQAGWSAAEVAAGMRAWAESEFRPPVPRPRPYVSAKDAFIYAIMFAALAMTTFYITSLGFELIDRWLPGLEKVYYDYSNWTIRWAVATLIVSLPIFLVLNRRVSRAALADPAQRRSAVRKWFGYVTLFLAAMALAGDLIFTIYSGLNGDLTLRVAAKSLLVATTAGLIFWYFRTEMESESHEH